VRRATQVLSLTGVKKRCECKWQRFDSASKKRVERAVEFLFQAQDKLVATISRSYQCVIDNDDNRAYLIDDYVGVNSSRLYLRARLSRLISPAFVDVSLPLGL